MPSFLQISRSIAALVLTGLVAALPLRASANSELTIQITRGMTAGIPIAIVPFAGAGPLPVDVAAVVEADLARSGRFETLARKDMPQQPSTAGAVDAAQWRLLKTDYVTVGRLVPNGAGLSIEFEVINSLTGQRVLGYALPTSTETLRLAGHRVADMIYEKILGVPGAFATRIAYVSIEGPPKTRHWRLVVADADGENSRVVLDSPEPIMSPSWSPDGARLAYVSFEGRNPAIYVQTLTSGARERLSGRAGINGAPAWSPDGRRLALTLSQPDGNLDVFLMDLESRQITRITDDPAIDTEPCFAADGQSLYFTSDRAGRPQIYRIALTGGKPTRVTFEGAYNARARIAPDGKSLAVVTQDQGAYRIALVDVESGRSRVLTTGRLDTAPSFAPNGQNVMYSTRDGSHAGLATVSVDGSVTTRINGRAGEVRDPAWSPKL